MRLLLLFIFLPFTVVAQRPNIIYIMSDDHDKDAISAYSKTLISTPNIDRLGKEGMRFQKAFVGNSICGPARATLLTGQHSHKNGMIDNVVRFDSSKMTMPKILQAAGYQTAIIGKWHLQSYPTGFDYWKILPGQGQYFQPRLINMDGDTSTYKGYVTDVITSEAFHWLDKRDKEKLFLLLLHYKAPHRYFLAPLKFIEIFHRKKIPEPATLYLDSTGRNSAWKMQTMSILPDMQLCSDLKVDPAYLMDIPHLKPDSAEIRYYHAIINRIPLAERKRVIEIYKERGEILQRLKPTGKELLKYKYQWYMQDYLACVASIDENVGKLLDYLDQHKLDQNTVVIYTSDQGFYLGENGWFDKRFMYDKSMQIPLLVRWPGKIKKGSLNFAMVQNIDFAPTFLDLAAIKKPEWMQGISFREQLLDAQKKIQRDVLYYHYYEYYGAHTVLPHLGIRTTKYKLIYYYTVNEWELFDLDKDPQELKNLYYSKSHQDLLRTMKEKLLQARNKYDDHEKAGTLE